MVNTEVLVLDGGIGHELKSRGVATLCEQLGFHDLFAAGSIANREKPNIVEDVHVAYIEAHADIITANNFGCTQHALGKVGEAGNACNLIRDACHIAQKARIRAGVPGVKIAGVLPPLGESYAGVLENVAHMEEEYCRIAKVLDECDVDVILCETMSNSREAIVAGTQALKVKQDKQLWISFSLDDAVMPPLSAPTCFVRSGEELTSAMSRVIHSLGKENINAILVNCCSPEVISKAIPIMIRERDRNGCSFAIGCYPNGFRQTTTEWLITEGRQPPIDDGRVLLRVPSGRFINTDIAANDTNCVLSPDAYAEYVSAWCETGASIVGGCCGIGPQHIAHFSSFQRRSKRE